MASVEGQLQPAMGFAIVGYAARFPGAADAAAFWDVLREGRDAISEVPEDRWDVDEFFDPDPDTPGKVATRRAGFVDDVTGFDAPFFGMSTREVRLLDPQHRLLLETAWRAVEHSGTAPTALANTNTGVFVGLATHDYLGMASGELTFPEIEAYMAIGTSNAAAAGRISYRLGLQGPSVAVDTACSSSLVAIHQACQALRFGECDLALAGGANVMLTPATMITFSHAHMLAPDGRCKTFDAAADGYVRGEGCGVIVVKRLEDAIRDGDRIRAVIRGSAINQDGASGGLTVPNGVAQQRVIAEALKRAGLVPADVDYLEAHGTGTSLGDPIEAQAAGAVLGEGRETGEPLLIGSAKTNIGHLEAAAGIAGVIKVILSLENELLPPHLHFRNPSPHIPWDRLALRVVQEATPWERNGRRRIAGISSFGFAGTNAHVILEEAPAQASQVAAAPEPAHQGDDRRFSILPISARTPEALVQIADHYRSWMNAHPEATLADVCLTAGVGRAHFEHRAALVVNSTESAGELLGALADDRPVPGLVRGVSDAPPKTAWLFTGQGSQYPGMARELFDTEPVFAETLNRCAAAVADVLEKPLLDVIFDADSPGSEETLRQTSYAQPALFAVEMGLARLWQSWGFEPDVVLGHSVGQYSAACIAGVLSLEDGALLMAERGRLFGSLPAGGRMVAVFTAAERVEGLTDEFPSLSVAAYNGANTVLSGPAKDLEQVVARLQADGVRCDWLETSHAFHSALLDPILDEFEAYADRFKYASPQRILVCNRTGLAIGRSVKLDGNYWRRHARQPVEFAKSVQTLSDLGCKVLLEIGPQPVLTAAALRAWPDSATTPRAIASLRKNTADHRQITEALADAYVLGHLPEFGAVRQGPARKLDLPTYPFQHRQYWYKDNRERPNQQQHTGGARTEAVRLLEDGRIEELADLLGAASGDDQTLKVLTKLAAQHNQQRNTQSIAKDRYEIRWEKPTVTASDADAGETLTWLIIGDNAEAVQPLVDALTAQGHRHQVLGLPVTDADEERVEGVLRAAVADDPALRILHVAALDSDTAPSMRSLLRMQHQVLSGTRRLFRAAAAAELRQPIWLITRGAQRITDADIVSPDQSCLWGFGRAASLEYPQLWGGLADLAEGTADEWSRFITRVAAAPSGEDQFALRDQTVYVPRLLRRVGAPSATPLALHADATYLVTGGLGSIGLEITGFLAAHGAKHLVLTSRRSPSDAVQLRIDALREQHGSDIQVVAADVADTHDVARLLATVKAELPPLAGIVHAAGEIGTTPLNNLDDAEVDHVFAGKVWGAWHLSEAAADLKLDFFLSTSSIASVWGGYGQTAYGAANAFLDGLAWRLREQGVSGISVNFGPWAAGMADEESRAKLAKRGVRTLSPTDALAGMADLLTASSEQGVAQGVVARIDWARFLPLYQQAGRRSFLAELEREVPSAAPVTTSSGKTQLVERLTNAPVQQRRKLLADYLRDAVAEVTRVDASEIREDAGFFDLGMDSLMAVELRRRIEQGVGKEIPATLAMDYPRLSDVVDYLLGDVLGLSEQAAKSGPSLATAVTTRTDEPIAIVAVSCRFPGAPNPEAFWELLSDGVDAIREVPEDRFDIDEFYDPDPDTAGKTYTRFGGFLDGIDGFDPEFFGISPREAVWIEPQQRLMLETVWEGLERAGYAPSALRGSRTGIFAGVAANEYAHLLSAESIDKIEPYFITGNALNAISGRVAFALGLEGPAVAVDTACSSSLVAVHQACQALHSGDCDLAVAGGVNVLLSPVTVVAASRARMLSPVGRCKTFDASADGYVRSEGCGVLVLKRLSDAVRDGDRVAAVIPGTAVNQDGASSGLTVPNGGAQQRLIATALARAGLAGGEVDYLEAHGTGTPLGDPIEVQAAGAIYGAARDADRPLLMGSVKTNIGHLESASGAAGLIKVVLSLQHRVLPQSLHFDNPSPHIPWDSLPVRVVDKSIPWEANGRPRRAGVSSFGFTGTNAHVLIEEAPAQPVTADEQPADDVAAAPESDGQEEQEESVNVLALSARSSEALVELAQRYGSWVNTHPEADIAEVCRTAGVGRSHFEHRAALVVDSVQSAGEALAELAENRLRPGVVRGECTDRPTTAWLFTGQGSQYPGMARELFDAEPVFAETVKRCADAVREILPRPLLEVVFATDRETGGQAGETLKHTSFAQPALFAIEMGLARLWQSWGIEPDVVLGHSVGQYAAACVAGVFSLEDGARLMAERGRLFGSLPDGGRMVAVFTDPKQVEQVAGEFPRVSVAAYNGPNTVLSGPGEDLEQVVAKFGDDAVRCTWLETSHAFHSELLEPVLGEFESYAGQFEFAVPTLPLVCNRTGAILTAETPLDAQYWRRHSRQPVQFAESVRTVAALGCSVLMEIGPQPVLTGAAVQVWPEHLAAPRAIVSLRKGVNDRRQIAEALATAYVSGHRPDFGALHHEQGRKIELPTYPFQRRRFWPKASAITFDGPAMSGLLGSAKDLASGDCVYTSRLSVKSQPWLSDHVIYGTVVVPGATYAAMALAAVGTPAHVKDVFFYEPIILPEKSSREVQLTLHPLDDGGGWKFQVHSRPYGVRDAEWSLNSDGTVVSGVDDEPTAEQADPIDAAIERMDRMRPQELFETFADMELAWGPNWSGSLKSLWLGEGEAIGDITVGEELAENLGAEPMHPVLLDLCTGVAFPAFPALLAAEQGVNDLFLPLRYGQVALREKMPRRFYCRARWHTSAIDAETQVFDLDFVDRDGRQLGGIREFTVKRAPREALLRGLGGDATRLLYTVGWHEVPPSGDDAGNLSGTWLIAGFGELAAKVPGCISFDRTTDPELLGQLLTQAQERGLPISGVVWRSTGPSGEESSADVAARLETEISNLLTVVHTVQGGQVKLPGGLWIVTERAVATESSEPVDPVQAALWGLGRTIINEEPALRCRLIDSDGAEGAASSLAGLLGAPVQEPELALRQGKFLASRLLPWARSGHLVVPRTTDYVLAPTERGAIDNLRLTESEVAPPDEGYVQVRVEAAGLNFRDVLNVLGLYPGDPGPIGGDFAGTVTQSGDGVTGLEVGQRVYGFMQGAFSSRFNVPAQLLAPIPDGVSAVDAATIPAAALTARLAFDWAQLKPGDRVLIHAASGGVGLAAIQMAQQHGAIVFATASTYKRATLRKLGVEHVYDSRTTDFADQILADTDGAGVDVVLNSLTNEGFLEATVRATAQNGRFAEIAKRDIWTPEQMAEARPDIAYEIVALDTVTFQEPERIRGLLTEVSEGLARGEWRPLPAEIYPLTEARAAFRRMQQARHIGKIVLQMPNPLQPRADRSYLITGGLGAIGLHTASYLAQLGAGDIVLTSRRAPDADAKQAIDDIMERYRCRIHTFAADVSDESEVAKLLEQIRTELPPLAGVAHLAGVLDDALLAQQSMERFQTTLAPKAFGACHLDRLTKKDDLDFFIVSSSVSSLFGSPGQANYSTANALLDGLVADRKAQGLPATGVNFGPWAQGGMASSEAATANISAQGLIPLEPSAALGALAEVVANGTGQATVIKANWQRAAKVLGSSRPPILDLVLPSAVGEVTGDSELLKQLQEIPVSQRGSFITEFLQREVQGFLRLAQPPAATSRFLDLGTDSLMAVELRNRLHSQFGGAFTINATAVFDYPTIGGLGEYLAAQLPDAESESADAESVAAPESESGEAESVASPEASSEPVAAPEPS